MNLEDLEGPRTRWIDIQGLPGPFSVLVQYAAPEDGDRFRKRMKDVGILRPSGEPADGRSQEYFTEFCKVFVKDWRGITVKETGAAKAWDPEKSPADVARIMARYGPALEAITNAVTKAEGFFGSAGDGSTQS